MSYIYKTYHLSPKTNTLHSQAGTLIMLLSCVWMLLSGIDGDLMLVSPAPRRVPTAELVECHVSHRHPTLRTKRCGSVSLRETYSPAIRIRHSRSSS
jgi:hypothetical protein